MAVILVGGFRKASMNFEHAMHRFSPAMLSVRCRCICLGFLRTTPPVDGLGKVSADPGNQKIGSPGGRPQFSICAVRCAPAVETCQPVPSAARCHREIEGEFS